MEPPTELWLGIEGAAPALGQECDRPAQTALWGNRVQRTQAEAESQEASGASHGSPKDQGGDTDVICMIFRAKEDGGDPPAPPHHLFQT